VPSMNVKQPGVPAAAWKQDALSSSRAASCKQQHQSLIATYGCFTLPGLCAAQCCLCLPLICNAVCCAVLCCVPCHVLFFARTLVLQLVMQLWMCNLGTCFAVLQSAGCYAGCHVLHCTL
jgi:hypothetical protein